MINYRCSSCGREYTMPKELLDGYFMCMQCLDLIALQRSVISIDNPLANKIPVCYHFDDKGKFVVLTRDEVYEKRSYFSDTFAKYYEQTIDDDTQQAECNRFLRNISIIIFVLVVIFTITYQLQK